MSLRFVTNVTLMLAGGLIVVCSQAFSAGIAGWIAFGIGLGILAMVGGVQLDRSRGWLQHGLDGVAGLLAIWTVIAAVVFSGSPLAWLVFAEGLGFVGLALVGLVAHELSTERVVHSLAPAERSLHGDRFEHVT